MVKSFIIFVFVLFSAPLWAGMDLVYPAGDLIVIDREHGGLDFVYNLGVTDHFGAFNSAIRTATPIYMQKRTIRSQRREASCWELFNGDAKYVKLCEDIRR